MRYSEMMKIVHQHKYLKSAASAMSAVSVISSAFSTEPQADFDPLARAISITSQKI
jgi:hypothetical protein